jgi:hypothetical protein
LILAVAVGNTRVRLWVVKDIIDERGSSARSFDATEHLNLFVWERAVDLSPVADPTLVQIFELIPSNLFEAGVGDFLGDNKWLTVDTNNMVDEAS